MIGRVLNNKQVMNHDDAIRIQERLMLLRKNHRTAFWGLVECCREKNRGFVHGSLVLAVRSMNLLGPNDEIPNEVRDIVESAVVDNGIEREIISPFAKF